MLLVNLPDVILKHLQSFLTNDDIHYFLNSNKHHFFNLKRETIYFSLNTEKSREYVESERFREIILKKVKDRRKQVGLLFDRTFELPNISDIIAHKIHFDRSYPHFPDKVRSLVLPLTSEVKEIPFLAILEELKLYKCNNIQDFTSLSHLKKLELFSATQLTDLTPLRNIPHLSFVHCPNIQDFSILSSEMQQSLYVYQSSTIKDVSFLRNMITVELYKCNEIFDVSPLKGVKNLSLSDCSNIKDISSLGNHHRLSISECHSIERGYKCFRSVRHANFLGSEVSDLSVFREAKSLGITFFKSMESQLLLLKDIPELMLYPTKNSGKEIYEITELRTVRLSFFHDIIKIHDTSFPSQLLHLKVINCNQIVKMISEGKVSIFYHLQSLHLSSCAIEHVNGLGDIPTVILQSCLNLRDINGLGRNRCVELTYCPMIHDISSLATVSIVKVMNCDGIVDYSCLSPVPRLKIVRRK